MKKVLAVFAALVLISAAAVAEVDLSGMSYEELVALKDQINLAIWNSEEWEEVEVPQGVWKVGEDIPEGKWTIRCADVNRRSYMMKECDLEWGNVLSSDGTSIKWTGAYDLATVYNPEHEDYQKGQVTEYTWDAKKGQYFIVKDAYAPAVFSPYSGKPSLKFKKK